MYRISWLAADIYANTYACLKTSMTTTTTTTTTHHAVVSNYEKGDIELCILNNFAVVSKLFQ